MPEQPNILLIFTDQHRLSAMGCYGETPCQTPNLDRLAARSVRFETAYTCCPVCSPARATIMTGLFPHAHGVNSNVHNLGNSIHELADRPELLSRRLEGAGYACGYSGKWHLGTDAKTTFGSPNAPSLPRDVGFDGQNFPGHGGGGFNYPEYKAYLEAHGWTHEVKKPDGVRSLPGCGILQGPEESTVPYFLAENTIQLMDQYQKEKTPFFIWHNFWGPHGPYFTTQACYDLYQDVEIPPWPNFEWDERHENRPHQVKLHALADELPWEDWAVALRHYYAFMTLIDKQIGRILDHLETTGLADNTIVIFTADHGETCGSHGGLTDKGWQHFEEIQRIPFIVHVPEALGLKVPPTGTALEEWISLVDVYPTILDMAGAAVDESMVHGRSLLPLLTGQAQDWRDTAFIEFHGVNSLATNMVTCRHGELKYGWNCSSFDELYDLAKDPHETRNVISDPAYAAAADAMRQRLLAFLEETGYPGIALRQLRNNSSFGARA